MGRSVTRPLLNIREKPTLFQKLRAKLRADFLTFWWFLDFDLRANVVQKSYIMKTLLTLFVLLFSSSVVAKDVAFVNNSYTSAEWVYFTGNASSVAEWIYFTRNASSVADWIYVTNFSSNSDYTICFPSSFEYSEKHIAAIYVLYLK